MRRAEVCWVDLILPRHTLAEAGCDCTVGVERVAWSAPAWANSLHSKCSRQVCTNQSVLLWLGATTKSKMHACEKLQLLVIYNWPVFPLPELLNWCEEHVFFPRKWSAFLRSAVLLKGAILNLLNYGLKSINLLLLGACCVPCCVSFVDLRSIQTGRDVQSHLTCCRASAQANQSFFQLHLENLQRWTLLMGNLFHCLKMVFPYVHIYFKETVFAHQISLFTHPAHSHSAWMASKTLKACKSFLHLSLFSCALNISLKNDKKDRCEFSGIVNIVWGLTYLNFQISYSVMFSNFY